MTVYVTWSFIFEERSVGHLERKMQMVRSCLISALRKCAHLLSNTRTGKFHSLSLDVRGSIAAITTDKQYQEELRENQFVLH